MDYRGKSILGLQTGREAEYGASLIGGNTGVVKWSEETKPKSKPKQLEVGNSTQVNQSEKKEVSDKDIIKYTSKLMSADTVEAKISIDDDYNNSISEHKDITKFVLGNPGDQKFLQQKMAVLKFAKEHDISDEDINNISDYYSTKVPTTPNGDLNTVVILNDLNLTRSDNENGGTYTNDLNNSYYSYKTKTIYSVKFLGMLFTEDEVLKLEKGKNQKEISTAILETNRVKSSLQARRKTEIHNSDDPKYDNLKTSYLVNDIANDPYTYSTFFQMVAAIDPEPFSSLAAGVGGDVIELTADILDDRKSLGYTLQNLGINLGTTALSALTIFGGGVPKMAKVISKYPKLYERLYKGVKATRNIAGYKPFGISQLRPINALKILPTAMVVNSATSTELLYKENKTSEDYRNMAILVTTAFVGLRGAKNMLSQKKFDAVLTDLSSKGKILNKSNFIEAYGKRYNLKYAKSNLTNNRLDIGKLNTNLAGQDIKTFRNNPKAYIAPKEGFKFRTSVQLEGTKNLDGSLKSLYTQKLPPFSYKKINPFRSYKLGNTGKIESIYPKNLDKSKIYTNTQKPNTYTPKGQGVSNPRTSEYWKSKNQFGISLGRTGRITKLPYFDKTMMNEEEMQAHYGDNMEQQGVAKPLDALSGRNYDYTYDNMDKSNPNKSYLITVNGQLKRINAYFGKIGDGIISIDTNASRLGNDEPVYYATPKQLKSLYTKHTTRTLEDILMKNPIEYKDGGETPIYIRAGQSSLEMPINNLTGSPFGMRLLNQNFSFNPNLDNPNLVDLTGSPFGMRLLNQKSWNINDPVPYKNASPYVSKYDELITRNNSGDFFGISKLGETQSNPENAGTNTVIPSKNGDAKDPEIIKKDTEIIKKDPFAHNPNRSSGDMVKNQLAWAAANAASSAFRKPSAEIVEEGIRKTEKLKVLPEDYTYNKLFIPATEGLSYDGKRAMEEGLLRGIKPITETSDLRQNISTKNVFNLNKSQVKNQVNTLDQQTLDKSEQQVLGYKMQENANVNKINQMNTQQRNTFAEKDAIFKTKNIQTLYQAKLNDKIDDDKTFDTYVSGAYNIFTGKQTQGGVGTGVGSWDNSNSDYKKFKKAYDSLDKNEYDAYSKFRDISEDQDESEDVRNNAYKQMNRILLEKIGAE